MREKVKATPAARRIAAERGIRLEDVPAEQGRGYITAEDVAAFKSVGSTPLARSVAAYHGVDIGRVQGGKTIRKQDVLAFVKHGQNTGAIPVRGMRKVIAARMTESMQAAPQYTMFMDYDMHGIMALFGGYRQRCAERGRAKPTLTDVFIKLFAVALSEMPVVNSTFTDEEIIVHGDINIGLAVAVEDGLVVPNIKNADRLALQEITDERARLVERARAGRLLPDEYEGGTFTVSNLGGYPVEYATPIINQPESAIVAVGATVDRVVPAEEGIAVHPVMGMSFTFDHRHLDGAVGGMFMKTVRQVFDRAAEIFG